MALSWPIEPGTLEVVGFSGTPLHEAAGLKSPVFHHRPSGRSFAGNPDAPSSPTADWDESEVQEFVRRGLITKISSPWPNRIEGGVVLYASKSFLCPPGHSMKCLDPRDLRWDDAAQVYVDYDHRAWCEAILYRWGRTLVDHVQQELQHIALMQMTEVPATKIKPLLNAAQRARFCALAGVHDHLQLRVDAFTGAVAALQALKRSDAALLRDAEREFDERTIQEIQARARVWLKPMQPISGRQRQVPVLSWGIKYGSSPRRMSR